MSLNPAVWRSRLVLRIGGVLAAVFCATVAVRAEATSAAVVKAAFLYNFAKFAGWPAASLVPGQELAMCVLGDAGVADALEQTIKGRSIEGHRLLVQVVKTDTATLSSCHLLYISSDDVKRSASLLTALRTSPVLTVSNGDRFAASGGIAQLILENDRMRFAINIAAAERARLHLSSKLLGLAQIVKDE